MTNNEKEEILKAFVERAIEGGWNIDNREEYLTTWYVDGNGIVFHFEDEDKKYMKWFSLPDLIASADFMHSVYGDELVCYYCGYSDLKCEARSDDGIKCLSQEDARYLFAYQYHQQQLVILDDDERLEYIKRTMGEN